MRTTRTARILIAAALMAALTLGVTGCTAGGQPTGGSAATGTASTSSEPIRVGAILSLTGPYAGLGASEKKALELEVKRINDAGGINGRQVELVIEDDGTDAAKAQAAATKLIDQDKVVAILGASGTGQTMSMRADVERAAVPNVSMAGGSAVTDKVSPQVFQVPWPNRLVVPFVLAAMKKNGVSKIGVITDTGGYGKDGLAVIKAEAPKAGITIVGEQTFNQGDTDMTAQLTKLMQANPDAILVWTAGSEGATILKNRDQLKITKPFYGGSGQGRKEFPAGAGAAADGFLFGTGKMLVPEAYGTGSANYKVVTDFAKRYKDAYGADIDIFAGHAYDALNLVADAAKRVQGDLTPEALRNALEQTKGLTLVGGTYTFSPTDHNGLTQDDLQMYEVKDGSFVIVK